MDSVVEDHSNDVLAIFKSQKEAIDGAPGRTSIPRLSCACGGRSTTISPTTCAPPSFAAEPIFSRTRSFEVT